MICTRKNCGNERIGVSMYCPEHAAPGSFHGCTTGDCPHDKANECVRALIEYVQELENRPTHIPSGQIDYVAWMEQLRVENAKLVREGEAFRWAAKREDGEWVFGREAWRIGNRVDVRDVIYQMQGHINSLELHKPFKEATYKYSWYDGATFTYMIWTFGAVCGVVLGMLGMIWAHAS